MDCFKENCKKYEEAKKKALENCESVMDAIYELIDLEIDCKNCSEDCELKDKENK